VLEAPFLLSSGSKGDWERGATMLMYICGRISIREMKKGGYILAVFCQKWTKECYVGVSNGFQ
jgi:hypothetical protein